MKFSIRFSIVAVFIILFLTPKSLYSCTIFCASDSNKTLMGGNEDWHDPFSKIWVHETSKDNYGVLYMGHSDFQVQFGVNEHGLAVDFAAITKIEGTNLTGLKDLDGDMANTILSKCKTVKEAMIYLENYKYQSPYHQMLVFDSSGASLVVNQDGVIKNTENYQVTTNNNYCVPEKRGDCQRFSIIDNSLSKKPKISISLFKELLSRTHQEDANPTQYSYILDATTNKLHLYSFHNYQNEVILDYKDVIKKGFMLNNFKSLFPINYMENNFRTYHKDSLKQVYINRLYKEDAQTIIKDFDELRKEKPEVASYPFLILDVAYALINETTINESKGKPFYYWYYPREAYFKVTSQNVQLKKALALLTYLENVPKDNPKQNIGAFEFKGLVYALLKETAKAKEYYKKTIEVSPSNTGNYKRAKWFLETM